MRDNLTEVLFIQDRSGSMHSIAEATISGYNQFISEQKKTPGDVNFTLVQFDDKYEVPVFRKPLNETKDLDATTFVPRGMTAMNDAICKAVDDLGVTLSATPENERPSRVIVIIQTDGYENASRKFSQAQVRERIEHQRTKYNWQFVFLGANIDVDKVAADFSIPRSASAVYYANATSTGAMYSSVSNMVTRARTVSLGDLTKTMSFDQDERARMAVDEDGNALSTGTGTNNTTA